MRAGKPIWTTSSFLIYTGGLTVLGAGIGALGYLSSTNGSGALAGWALLVLVVLYGLAHDLRRYRDAAAELERVAATHAADADVEELLGLVYRDGLDLAAEAEKHLERARALRAQS